MEPSIVAWLMVPAPPGRTCSSRGSGKLKCWSERQACVGPGCGMADSTVNGRFASASASCARLQIPVCIGRFILRRQRIFTRRFTFLFANPPVILRFSPSDLVAPSRLRPSGGVRPVRAQSLWQTRSLAFREVQVLPVIPVAGAKCSRLRSNAAQLHRCAPTSCGAVTQGGKSREINAVARSAHGVAADCR